MAGGRIGYIYQAFLEHLLYLVNASQCVVRQQRFIWPSPLLHDVVCSPSFLTVLPPCLFISIPELSLFYQLLFSVTQEMWLWVEAQGHRWEGGGAGWETLFVNSFTHMTFIPNLSLGKCHSFTQMSYPHPEYLRRLFHSPAYILYSSGAQPVPKHIHSIPIPAGVPFSVP